MRELAEAVVDAARKPCKAKLLYKDDVHLTEKIETMAKEIYRASRVDWAPMTRTTAKRFEDNGWNFPICMAKTHLSVTADKKLRGAPTGHMLPIRELRVAAGAQQVIAYAGDIMTLPGLPSNPNAWDIDLDPNGLITGVLGT
jgi:formate--tetrahydrofolate ligase